MDAVQGVLSRPLLGVKKHKGDNRRPGDYGLQPSVYLNHRSTHGEEEKRLSSVGRVFMDDVSFRFFFLSFISCSNFFFRERDLS